MNHSMPLKLATAACVIALLACGLKVFFKTVHLGFHYAHAEQYAAGGAELEGAVKNLDIHWIDGAVNIAYHDKDTVEIAETAAKAIPGDAALRWWLDGDTLRIQYAKSGRFSLRGLNKALTVTLPEGSALGELAIDATSGDVTVPALQADSVRVDLTSGDLSLRQSGSTERMALSSTSGNISADVSVVGKLAIDLTSGCIRTNLESAGEVSLSTTSGDIALNGGAQKARVDSTSGKIDVTLTAFDDLVIHATSGSVSAALPSKPGYRADINTTSGRFDSAVALSREGGSYSCGDGSGRLTIDTTSGNVRLEDADGH